MYRHLVNRSRRAALTYASRRARPALPVPQPIVPSVAERFGKPLPDARTVISTGLHPDACLARLRASLGPDHVLISASPPPVDSPGAAAVDVMLTGKLRLPGLFEQQRLRGTVRLDGQQTTLALHVRPRPHEVGVVPLLWSSGLAVIIAFVAISWITGPAGVSILAVLILSLLAGLVVGAYIQGALNIRRFEKRRRRLVRPAHAIATLLDGHVSRWP